MTSVGLKWQGSENRFYKAHIDISRIELVFAEHCGGGLGTYTDHFLWLCGSWDILHRHINCNGKLPYTPIKLFHCHKNLC